ncbi:DNA-(apurinic or apyrimidinic site) endonuclease 2-like [Homarus americanus]|uniref:DNA-(apurinic or apyrimidinic site) endonuclease 2 n=1 Tax=Homarus americanus TaxID=6706 RepID=A0A8J5JVS7_HOMAM|nr:DNA-(apurinic or apyrimidinic site) endonuclease 2-like [Homarus americanus]
MPFRILSWNINGLRSFKTGMKEFLSSLNADIICFQETKVTRDKLEEPQAIVEGHYMGELHYGGGTTEALPAEWTKEELKDLDSEGRAVITQHIIKDNNGTGYEVAVINVYCPRVDPEKPERRVFKLRFYELLRQRAAAIHATGCHVVVVGDINTSHKRIDHCDPDESEVSHLGLLTAAVGQFITLQRVVRYDEALSVAVFSDAPPLRDRPCPSALATLASPSDFERRLGRRYLDKFLIPLHKKEDDTENKEKSLDKECTSLLHFPDEKDFGRLKIFNCRSSEETLIPTDISAQMRLKKETIEEQGKADTKRERQTINTEEFEEDEISDDHLLVSGSDFQVVDTFRYFYPNKRDVFTCWNTFTNSRSTNYGTRIDYIFCDEEFLPCVENSLVLSDVMGSDHCPVAVVIKGELVPAPKLPLSCTKFFPEFRGEQQKLSSYFRPKSSLPVVQRNANQNSHIFSRTESVVGRISQSEAKRKTSNTKIKPPKTKKVCAENQRKLSFFFTLNANNQNTGTVSVNLSVGSRCDEQSTELNATASTRVTETRLVNLSQKREQDEDSGFGSQDLPSDNIPADSSCSKAGLKSNQNKNSGWGFLMKGPKPLPLCPGHREPAVLMTVKKKGPNTNRQFYGCARGVGKEGDPNARCKFFKWVGK